MLDFIVGINESNLKCLNLHELLKSKSLAIKHCQWIFVSHKSKQNVGNSFWETVNIEKGMFGWAVWH